MESIAEIWKDIQGYEGLYQVSNLGRVKSLGRFVDNLVRGHYWQEERILKPHDKGYSYLNVKLYKDRKTKEFQVHRLVAIAFIPNPENKPQIDHINAIKTDNRVQNLRWVSAKENMNNPLTLIQKIGKNNPMFGKKHSEETKQKIRKAHLGKRKSEEAKEKIRGKNHPRARAIRNIDTKEIFDTIKDAEKKYNLTCGCICYAIKHNSRSAGYHWKYV